MNFRRRDWLVNSYLKISDLIKHCHVKLVSFIFFKSGIIFLGLVNKLWNKLVIISKKFHYYLQIRTKNRRQIEGSHWVFK